MIRRAYICRVDISAVFIMRCRPFTILYLYMLIKSKRIFDLKKTSDSLTPLPKASGGRLPL